VGRRFGSRDRKLPNLIIADRIGACAGG